MRPLDPKCAFSESAEASFAMDRVDTDIVMRVLDDKVRDEAKDRLDDDAGFSEYDMVDLGASGNAGASTRNQSRARPSERSGRGRSDAASGAEQRYKTRYSLFNL